MNKEYKIWVFRLSEDEPGNPKTSCPIDLDRKSIKQYLDGETPIDDDDSMETNMDLLKEEFFKYGKLRQGWGYEHDGLNLDLRQKKKEWLENYMKLSYKLWGDVVNCKDATGRRNILKLMLCMKAGDIIFTPKIPHKSQFTVTMVKKEYNFCTPPDKFIRGHVIEVENTNVFKYGNGIGQTDCKSLPAKIFMPYRKAIDEIKTHHRAFHCIESFLRTRNII